jgi:glycosyltransferase involved in cell wall biosynthesis
MVDRESPQPVPLPGPVSILMPVCNEAAVIEEVIEEWVRDVFQYLPPGSELVFDDGASDDGTREILGRMEGKYPSIRVFDSPRDGFAAAARRLYRSARCPLVFFTDSDGQYAAAEFWKLAGFIAQCDVVHGAKVGRQDPLLRRVFSAAFNRIASLLFGHSFGDINSAFRLMRTGAIQEPLDQVRVMPTLFNAELLLRCLEAHLTIRQVAVVHRRRRAGRSRGLPAYRYLLEAWWALLGLLRIKAAWRGRSRPVGEYVGQT